MSLDAKDRPFIVVFGEQAMWRAFFFAVGTMLIILGLECLVVERFFVQKARIPSFVAKVLDGSPGIAAMGANGGLAQRAGNGSGVSSYGPSRFEDNYSTQNQAAGNYYGGFPSSSQPADTNSQFSLAGFGQQQNNIAPLTQPSYLPAGKPYQASANLQARVIRPKDWMPWSLLAAGTLVVLYTNTTSGRGFSKD